MENRSKRPELNRRALLAGTGSALAAGIMFRAASLDAAAQDAQPGRLFLHQAQANAVEALAEVIWPTTEDSAGGRDAGVMNYIDRALAGPYSEFQTVYNVGLEWLDFASLNAHGAAFAALGEDQQVEIVSQIFDGELGEVSAVDVSRSGHAIIESSASQSTPDAAATPVGDSSAAAEPARFIDGVQVAGVTTAEIENLRAFLNIVRVHVMEGLFSDPVHGGNRDFAGWAAVGYPGPYVIFTEEQQQSFEPLNLPFQSIADF